MIKKLRSIASFQGEMGRDDYWLSTLWRILVLLVLLSPFLAILASLETASPIVSPEQAVGSIYYYGVIYTLGFVFLMWPPLIRRWRDLGGNGRLNKFFVYILLLNGFLPNHTEVTSAGLKALLIIVTLITIYPGWVLSFSPGKKHKRLKESKAE